MEHPHIRHKTARENQESAPLLDVPPGKGSLFCFGLGETATELGRILLQKGWRVQGTVRHQEKCDRLRAEGFDCMLLDADTDKPDLTERFTEVTHILQSIPPSPQGDPVLDHYADMLENLQNLSWICYLSTTGVYGDHKGGRVDEDTPPHPTTERGKRRLAAEQAWTALAEKRKIPLAIFRLAGIYSSTRNPFNRILSGQARQYLKPGQLFNRIHVTDIVNALLGSLRYPPHRTRIYNICDEEPAPPQEVLLFAAQLLGLPPPPAIPFEKAELSPMAKSFYAESKACDNLRMKQELQIQMRYPTYREGLQAIFQESIGKNLPNLS